MPAEALSLSLCRKATALYAQALPTAIEQRALDLLADTLVVAAPGQALASSQAVAQALPKALGNSRVWFTQSAYCAADAAFINCLSAGALDFDSLNHSIHADLIALPAAWAMAEALGKSPKEMLRAYAISSEVLIRLTHGSSAPSKGWSPTALFGGIGAALACGLLMEPDAATLQNALGLAFVQASGTQQANVEKTLAKRLQPAFAVRAGVIAAQLARAGATGPSDIFTGAFGLRSLYQPGDDQALLEGFGQHWHLLDTQIKPFPICACSHAAVQALLDLQSQHKIAAHQVAQIEARISPFMQRLVGADFSLEHNLEVLGQFNLRYHLASTLVRGPMTLAHLSTEALTDPALMPVIARTQLTIDTQNIHELAPATVVLTLNDGRVFKHTCTALPGSSARPLSAAAWQDKAHACLKAAGQRFTQPSLAQSLATWHAARVIEPLWSGA